MSDSRQDVLIRQLQGGAAKKSGVVMVTWPGASDTSNVMTVAHGVPGGVVPRVQAQMQDQTNVGDAVTTVVAVSSSQLQVRLKTFGFTPANTVQTPVAWWAY